MKRPVPGESIERFVYEPQEIDSYIDAILAERDALLEENDSMKHSLQEWILDFRQVDKLNTQLLEALERITKSVEDTQRIKGIGPRDSAVVQLARQAIAKAKGEGDEK